MGQQPLPGTPEAPGCCWGSSFRAAGTQGGLEPQGSLQHWGGSIFCPLCLGPNPFQPADVSCLGMLMGLLAQLQWCSSQAPLILSLQHPSPCAAASQPLAKPICLPPQAHPPTAPTSSGWGQKPVTGVASATSPPPGWGLTGCSWKLLSSHRHLCPVLSCPWLGAGPLCGPCVHGRASECLPLGQLFLGSWWCVTEEGAEVAAGRECSSYPPSGSFLPC